MNDSISQLFECFYMCINEWVGLGDFLSKNKLDGKKTINGIKMTELYMFSDS